MDDSVIWIPTQQDLLKRRKRQRNEVKRVDQANRARLSGVPAKTWQSPSPSFLSDFRVPTLPEPGKKVAKRRQVKESGNNSGGSLSDNGRRLRFNTSSPIPMKREKIDEVDVEMAVPSTIQNEQNIMFPEWQSADFMGEFSSGTVEEEDQKEKMEGEREKNMEENISFNISGSPSFPSDTPSVENPLKKKSCMICSEPIYSDDITMALHSQSHASRLQFACPFEGCSYSAFNAKVVEWHTVERHGEPADPFDISSSLSDEWTDLFFQCFPVDFDETML